MKFKERSISVLVLLLCGLWYLYSGRISDSTMPGAPGPRFFPYVIIGTLVFLTLLYEVLRSRGPAVPAPAVIEVPAAVTGDGAEGEGCIDPDDLVPDRKYVVFSFLLIFLYVLGIDYLGFYPATVPAVFIVLKAVLRMKSWTMAIAGTAAIAGSVFVIFTVLLQLPLPRGQVW
jgi:hypothetical protein